MSGFDARDVQDLVDQIEQMLPAADDLLHALAVLRRQRILLKQLREPEDGVERRAQLVTHAGEEVALGAIGAVGFDTRIPQRHFHRPLLGDVAGDADQVAAVALFVGDRDALGMERPPAVFAGAKRLLADVHQCLRLQRGAIALGQRIGLPFGNSSASVRPRISGPVRPSTLSSARLNST